MRDIALQLSGGLAILAAVIHGIVDETRVFALAQLKSAWIRLMLRLVWQCGAAASIGLGVLLAAAPSMASGAARSWIVGIAVADFGFGATANAYAARARHFRWMVLAMVCVLAFAGR